MSTPYILEPGIIQIFDNPNGRCERLCEKAFNEYIMHHKVSLLCMVRYWNTLDPVNYKICSDCPFEGNSICEPELAIGA